MFFRRKTLIRHLFAEFLFLLFLFPFLLSTANSLPDVAAELSPSLLSCPVRSTVNCPAHGPIARQCKLITTVVNDLKQTLANDAAGAEFTNEKREHLATLLQQYLQPKAVEIARQQPEIMAEARELVKKFMEMEQQMEEEVEENDRTVAADAAADNRRMRRAIPEVNVGKVLSSLQQDLNNPLVLTTLAYLSAEILFLPAVLPIQLGGFTLCAMTMYGRTLAALNAKEREKMRQQQQRAQAFD